MSFEIPNDGTVLKGFCAFPILEFLQDTQKVKLKHIGWLDLSADMSAIQQAWFGDFGHVTFCWNKEDAVNEAVASTSRCHPQAAANNTWWLIVEVTLTATQCCGCFKTGTIVLASAKKIAGWRYIGDMPLTEVHHATHAMRVGAMGNVLWAHVAIGRGCKPWQFPSNQVFLETSQCQECLELPIPTWQGWCATCWNQQQLALENVKRQKTEHAGKTKQKALEDVKHEGKAWPEQRGCEGEHALTVDTVDNEKAKKTGPP